MYGNAFRPLIAALAAAAAIGLAQPSMAQDNDPEEEQETSAEEAPAPSLEALMQALADALATLGGIKEQLQALQQAQTEAERKTLALSIPTGLSRSTEEPVYSAEERERATALAQGALDAANAALAETETDRTAAQAAVTAAEAALASQIDKPHPRLAELLPDPDIRFPALSAALNRDFSNSRVSLSDGAHVRAVSSDGEGGFKVTYEIGGEGQTIHFEASEYRSQFQNYAKLDGSSVTHLLWAFNDSFTRNDTNRNQGSRQFRYVDGHGSAVPGYRVYMSFGARTEADGFPAATATYAGRFEGEVFSRSDPVFATSRSYIQGNLNLTADFEDGAIEGRINRIFIDPPGGDTAGYVLPSTTRFDIEHGRMADGQFTATLTGVDTNADAATNRTVAGYKGAVLGEFYGPAAEEVGGVLNAESDAHDSVIGGWFGGRPLRSVVPAGESSAPSSVGVERDYITSSVQAADDSSVTAISSDGEGGYNVTYSIDGVEHSVHLTGSDYGSDPNVSNNYHKEADAQRYYLWSPVGSFFGASEYDHFDVAGWTAIRYSDDGSGATEYATRNFAVYGARTEAANLPAGEASYAGRMAGEIWQADNPNRSTRTFVRGDLSLTADFDESTVTGTIDGMETATPGQSYQAISDELTISGGSITDSTFTAGLTGTGGEDSRFEGDVDGQFFGPDAKEVGGVLEATHSGDSTILTGWFGGKRDDLAETLPATSE